jgi:hypothetical protein
MPLESATFDSAYVLGFGVGISLTCIGLVCLVHLSVQILSPQMQNSNYQILSSPCLAFARLLHLGFVHVIPEDFLMCESPCLPVLSYVSASWLTHQQAIHF